MFRKLSIFLLRNWQKSEFPEIEKAIVLMAPHTSMWDFYYGKLYFATNNIKPLFLIKKEVFVWIIAPILKKLGGVPVDRGKSRGGVAQNIIDAFKNNEKMMLVITPEGTRHKTKNWKKGFIKIAKEANIPVICGYIDYEQRKMGIFDSPFLDLSGSDDDIMKNLKSKYLNVKGAYPENFTT